jgi:hypothetical protein
MEPGGVAPPLLTSALGGDELSLHDPAALRPGKEPRVLTKTNFQIHCTIGHTKCSQCVTVFNSRYLVATSNGGRSPSSVS